MVVDGLLCGRYKRGWKRSSPEGRESRQDQRALCQGDCSMWLVNSPVARFAPSVGGHLSVGQVWVSALVGNTDVHSE